MDRAQKLVVDSRKVCLKDWEVRDKAQELLEKLCAIIEKIISRKNLGRDSEEKEELSYKSLFKQVDLYLGLLRKTNEESESTRRVSQILETTLFALKDMVKRFIEPSFLDNCSEVDKQLSRDRVKLIKNST